MKQNEYNAAEVVEIGEAQSVVLGQKTWQDLDSSGMDPMDRYFEED
jgi:hypothetical protein